MSPFSDVRWARAAGDMTGNAVTWEGKIAGEALRFEGGPAHFPKNVQAGLTAEGGRQL